jgi:hypothetical protein
MATNTVINQTQLTAEQKALAAAELQQMQRRMAFEDFAGEILLGFKPGVKQGSNLPMPTTPTTPTVNAPSPTTTNAGGGSSAVGNAIGSAAQLQQGIAGQGVGGADILGSLGKYLTPGVVGGAAGLAIGGLSGMRPGSMLGNVIGDALTDMSPEPNRPDATDGTSVPLEPNRPDSTVGDIISGPTQAQISAQRAAQTALSDIGFQYVSDQAAQSQMDMMRNNPGGERYDHIYHQAATNAAQTMRQTIINEGGDPNTPDNQKRVSQFVNDTLAEIRRQLSGR